MSPSMSSSLRVPQPVETTSIYIDAANLEYQGAVCFGTWPQEDSRFEFFCGTVHGYLQCDDIGELSLFWRRKFDI